jgi:hypothetical protein
MIFMPRPLTPSSLRVLSLVARYGLYLWSPGSVAVLDNPWRTSVHVGSVLSLVKKGMLEARGEFEGGATLAGLEELHKNVLEDTGVPSVTISNIFVSCAFPGLDDPTGARQVGRSVLDAFRLVANQDPAAWEAIVDCALVDRDNPNLALVLNLTLESLAQEYGRMVDLEVTFTPLGPKAR